jgi:hypothetical protein
LAISNLKICKQGTIKKIIVPVLGKQGILNGTFNDEYFARCLIRKQRFLRVHFQIILILDILIENDSVGFEMHLFCIKG